MSKWLSASDRVRLASQLVSELENQFSTAVHAAVIKQFGIQTKRSPDHLFHTLLEDADDDSLAALGRHFTLDVPEKPHDETAGSPSSDVDAYAELVSAETALREVIRLAVPKWIDDLTQDEVAKLQEKRTEEDKRRDGITVTQDMLDYTEIYQLEKTINKNWDAVKPVLQDKKRTDVYISIILDVRNSIGHSRPVFAAERLLLAGAAGQIRNQLARYKAMNDGPHRHYPSLNSARDGMGVVAPSNPSLSVSQVDPFNPPPRLEVGNTVTFELEATDPRGRELIWTAYSVPGDQTPSMASHGDYYPVIADMRGERVSFTWTVSEDEVGESRLIAVTVANTGKYHRQRKWDDGCVFQYHVNPPPGA
ncbi:hypothetical protein [Mycobacterium sp.]|uniref:hypothetical protein n=1 Tax=Mycobacterium sp. TaxID=1785 RepID=UPI00121151E8|nr:hypothetical protein [Mycobacterium sp.]TAM69148.1 MAG: hypothetical protein EPN51_09705 [Mycobacterium sp.]